MPISRTQPTSTASVKSSPSKSKNATSKKSVIQNEQPPEKKLKLDTEIENVGKAEGDKRSDDVDTKDEKDEDDRHTKEQRDDQDETMDTEESSSEPAASSDTVESDTAGAKTPNNKSEKDKIEVESSEKKSIIHPFFGELK